MAKVQEESKDQKHKSNAGNAGSKGAKLSAPAYAVQKKDAKKKEEAPSSGLELEPAIKEKLVSGDFADMGDFSTNEDGSFKTFRNNDLNVALNYARKKWSVSIKNPVKIRGGDTNGKDIKELPSWVDDFTKKLIAQAPNTRDPWNHGKKKRGTWATRNMPEWNIDSYIAQRLVEAATRYWTLGLLKNKSKTGNTEEEVENSEMISGNISFLMERIGASRSNSRALLLGGTTANFYGWCGPASENAVSYSLMKNGYRFKTGKGPTTWNKVPGIKAHLNGINGNIKAIDSNIPKLEKNIKRLEKTPDIENSFLAGLYNAQKNQLKHLQKERLRMEKLIEATKIRAVAQAMKMEVTRQSAYFLNKWGKGKSKGKDGKSKARGGSGQKAWKAAMKTGDYFYLMTKSSPLSGHVATLIKEEPVNGMEEEGIISKIYYISGNAAGSAVRVEWAYRQVPNENYKYLTAASIGNKATDYKQKGKEKKNAAWGSRITSAVHRAEYKEHMKKHGLDYAIDKPQSEINKMKLGGKANVPVRPERGDCIWVVSTLKSNQFNELQSLHETLQNAIASGKDVSGLEGMKSNMLDKLGLEKMPDTIEGLYPGAMKYWENPAGFE